MFLRLRSIGFVRWCAGFLAAVVLNVSVDSPNYNPFSGAEDLSINEQESIVEIVLEQVMGFEDAIPEHEDPHQNDALKKNVFKFEARVEGLRSGSDTMLPTSDWQSDANADEHSPYSVYLDKFSPPPEA
jgi:hypothetical protein